MAGEFSFEDLAEEAGEAAEATQAPGKSTGEWISETMELLDKRGLLEPMLFGPEGAKEVQEQVNEQAQADAGDGGLDLDAEAIADAGEAIMDELGEDVTVAQLVQICRDNPALVNKKISENLGE